MLVNLAYIIMIIHQRYVELDTFAYIINDQSSKIQDINESYADKIVTVNCITSTTTGSIILWGFTKGITISVASYSVTIF